MQLTQAQTKDLRFFFTSLCSLMTSISFWQMMKYQMRIFNTKKDLKRIQARGKSQQIQDIIRNPNTKQIVYIKGTVERDMTQNPIVIRQKKLLGQHYIAHLSYQEKIYSNERYDLDKGQYTINLKQALKSCQSNFNKQFFLSEKNHKICVSNFDASEYEKALQIISWKQQKRSLTLAQFLQSMFLSLIRVFATLVQPNKNHNFIKGIQCGTRKVEAGIKVGTSLSVLGTIFIDESGYLRIQPIVMFKDRLNYILSLKDKIEQNMGKRNFWALLTALGGLYLGRRLYKYVMKNGWKMPWKAE